MSRRPPPRFCRGNSPAVDPIAAIGRGRQFISDRAILQHPSGKDETMSRPNAFLRPWLTIVGVVVLGALAAGCTEHRRPAVAAMVPQSTNGVFGYTDKMVAPDLYEVSYVSPRLHATQDA